MRSRIIVVPYTVASAIACSCDEKDVRLISHANEQGIIFGLTYVDLKNKAVFNGSALGKAYSARAVLERIHVADQMQNNTALSVNKLSQLTEQEVDISNKIARVNYEHLDEKSALELLSQFEYASASVPYEWRKGNKKKKKRRGIR